MGWRDYSGKSSLHIFIQSAGCLDCVKCLSTRFQFQRSNIALAVLNLRQSSLHFCGIISFLRDRQTHTCCCQSLTFAVDFLLQNLTARGLARQGYFRSSLYSGCVACMGLQYRARSRCRCGTGRANRFNFGWRKIAALPCLGDFVLNNLGYRQTGRRCRLRVEQRCRCQA